MVIPLPSQAPHLTIFFFRMWIGECSDFQTGMERIVLSGLGQRVVIQTATMTRMVSIL